MPLASLLLAVLASQDVLPPDPPAAKDAPESQKEKDWVDGRWNQTDTGPIVTASFSLPGGAATRGLAVRVGEKGEAAVCFDLTDLGVRAGWTGRFVRFDPARYGLVRPPKIGSDALFSVSRGAAWNGAKVRYRGLHLNGRRVVLDYAVNGTPILESPWFEGSADAPVFTRTLQVAPHDRALSLTLVQGKSDFRAATVSGGGIASKGDRRVLEIPPSGEVRRIKVLIWKGVGEAPPTSAPSEDLDELAKPGPPRWKPLTTKGRLGREPGPYVVDTITLPYDNPWKALLFLGGVDLFSNGDAAVCGVHGDVWIVRGIDEDLDELTWTRFATGLYQPLGLRIVDDTVLVRGRDQVTRLHDLNHDGEADFYENFNNAGRTMSGHNYVIGLETDAQGYFYYVDPVGVHRISPDGKEHETLASGFRNPNGIGVGPDGTVTVAPQQGTWTPSSAIFKVRKGGWYGHGGPKVTKERPLGYDPPICWIPHHVDNSSGSQVWVTSDRWGPLKGQMLSLCYGRSTLQLVLRDEVDGVLQGFVVPTSFKFNSGVCRGCFSPKDGQLYVAGLRGWQTSSARDGGLQRVRFTGGEVRLPTGVRVHTNGIRIDFPVELDREIAEDAGSYSMEQWNYRYSKRYGSDHYSVAKPDVVGHDPVTVASARRLDDGRSVFLEIPNLVPVMQARVRFSLRTASGKPLRGELDGTIRAMHPAFKP